MAKRYWINYLKEYIFTPTAPANDTTSQTGTFKALVERIQNRMTQQKGVPWYQDAPTTLSATATHIAEDASTAHGGSVQATQKDGTAQTFRATYNFTGPGVTVSDDSTNNRSNIDIAGGGGGGGGSAHIIQEEGASLTARSKLNFRGVGSTATDDAGNDRTNVDIRGNVHRSGTAPTSPVAGELWLDTSTTPSTLREYNGSTWAATSGTPSDSTVTDVKVASGANIAKSKLANLQVDTADLATNRSLLIIATSGTRPTSPLTGQAIYETNTQQVLVNTGTPSVPVWTSITATQTYQSQSYIEGLQLTWDAANTLGIEPGSAYIPASTDVLEVPTRLTRPVTFAASQTAFTYVYLFNNGGSPDILLTTDPPATPYAGTARYKGVGGTAASTAHRYLGALKPNGAATPAMYKWSWEDHNCVRMLQSSGYTGPFMILIDGKATAETTVSCANFIPPTAKRAQFRWEGFHPNYCCFGNSEDAITTLDNNSNLYMFVSNSAGEFGTAEFALDSSRAFSYRWLTAPATGNGLHVSLLAYFEQR